MFLLNKKEALAAKRMQWVTLEKPKGTIQKSKFDKDREKIEKLLKLRLPVQKITKLHGYTKTTLLSIPALTKETYNIPNGTWLQERLYRANLFTIKVGRSKVTEINSDDIKYFFTNRDFIPALSLQLLFFLHS